MLIKVKRIVLVNLVVGEHFSLLRHLFKVKFSRVLFYKTYQVIHCNLQVLSIVSRNDCRNSHILWIN
jgi:hypothetical protein